MAGQQVARQGKCPETTRSCIAFMTLVSEVRAAAFKGGRYTFYLLRGRGKVLEEHVGREILLWLCLECAVCILHIFYPYSIGSSCLGLSSVNTNGWINDCWVPLILTGTNICTRITTYFFYLISAISQLLVQKRGKVKDACFIKPNDQEEWNIYYSSHKANSGQTKKCQFQLL